MGRPKINESKSAANKKYCERYRAKNLSKLRIKERERKKAAREYEKYVHPEKYQERLKNDRIRAREYRARKKAEKQREDEAQCTNQVTPKSSSSTSQESTSVFTTRQSLNRSVLRAERYLPNSPRKKSEVLSNLAKKYELRIKYGNKRGRKTKTLTKEQDDWLLDVLERSDMTYTNPGRKDHIYMGKIDGEKVYEQKRYLLWSLREAWEAINGIGFKEKFDEPLSFSQFYRFIKSKKQIILQKDIPDTSCLCEVCENASLMARALKKSKSGHPLNAHDIVERYTCETNSVSCITNKCLECTPHKILQSLDNVSDESEESKSSSDDNDTDDFVTFSTWVKETGKIKKVVKSISKDQFYKDWYQTVGVLKEHIHRKRIQVESYNLQKTELKEGEALVHVDYSESYKNKQQNEIQSAYFGQSSFSLFTACVYYRDENGEFTKLPICVISESNDHSRAAALTSVDLVVKEVEKHIALSKIILWSDGCASQFRSRFVFKLLAHYRLDLEMSWFYNEAHHGKGPMDGIGGTVKNVVYRQVKSERVTINSARDFFNAANRFVPSITSLYQEESDVITEPDDIKNAPAIPSTLQIHKLVRKSKHNGGAEIQFFFLANSKEPCFTRQYLSTNLKCGHAEREFETLAMFKSTCAFCDKVYQEDEIIDWLKCPVCSQWFHESCFES